MNFQNLSENDLLLKERAEKCQVFNYHLEQIPITPSYDIYLIDCRGEHSLRATIERIDKLMENKNLKKCDVVVFPAVFAETIEEVGRDNFKNIEPVVDYSYRWNYITGMRREPSSYVTGLDHYLGWVGVIASPILKNHPIVPRLFEYYFHNCRQFMEAAVPNDDGKFLAKVNAIAAEGRTIVQKREIEQLFGMAAAVRPDMHRKYVMLHDEMMKNFGVVSHEVKDFAEYQLLEKKDADTNSQ